MWGCGRGRIWGEVPTYHRKDGPTHPRGATGAQGPHPKDRGKPSPYYTRTCIVFDDVGVVRKTESWSEKYEGGCKLRGRGEPHPYNSRMPN